MMATLASNANFFMVNLVRSGKYPSMPIQFRTSELVRSLAAKPLSFFAKTDFPENSFRISRISKQQGPCKQVPPSSRSSTAQWA
jgi:hypothetical protein